jgi:hypothetical protein
MPNGFNKACPSGNIMVDTWVNVKTVECGRCNGEGVVEWTDMEDYTDAIGHEIYRLKKTGHEPKTFRELIKLARQVKKDGKECDLCNGDGRIEE